MSEVIVVTSGKGGVGKTTVSANIGTGLAIAGKKVVLLDADIGLRNLDVVMGLENRVIYDLVNVIEGTCRLKHKSAVNPEQMQKLCASILEEGFDYVIIDCPAGIEQGFKNAIAGADKAIVVTTPEISAVRDADRIIGMLEANGLMNSKLILNRIRVDMVARNEMMSLEDVEEILAIDTLGIIPDDESIVISTNKGEPAVTNTDSLAGEAYQNIVKRILGENVPLMELMPATRTSLFDKLFSWLHKDKE